MNYYTVQDLINELSQYDPDDEVVLLSNDYSTVSDIRKTEQTTYTSRHSQYAGVVIYPGRFVGNLD